VHDENWNDISLFLDERLKEAEHECTMTDTRLRHVKDGLLDQANGVFLWLYWMVDTIDSMIRNGEEEEYILRAIWGLPTELRDIYKAIIDGINTEVEAALRISLWIALPQRHLPIDDLNRALGIADGKSTAAGMPRSWCENTKTLELRIMRVTRGLVAKTWVAPMAFAEREDIVIWSDNTIHAVPRLDTLMGSHLQPAFVLDHGTVCEFRTPIACVSL